MPKKYIIYTCLIGEYDQLREPEVIDSDADYYCVTDQKNITSNTWEMLDLNDYLPEELKSVSPSIKNRYVKWNPHIFFPKEIFSLYCDASISIINREVYNRIDFLIKNCKKIAMPKHWERDCSYEEAWAAVQAKKLSPEIAQRCIDFYKQESFPKHTGLYECGIIFRQHNDITILEFNTQIWHFIINGCNRDQLAVPFFAQKYGLNIIDWNGGYHSSRSYFSRFSGFFIYPHSNETDRILKLCSNQGNIMARAQTTTRLSLLQRILNKIKNLHTIIFTKKITILILCPEKTRPSYVILVKKILSCLKKTLKVKRITYTLLEAHQIKKAYKLKFEILYNFKLFSTEAIALAYHCKANGIPVLFECDDNFFSITYSNSRPLYQTNLDANLIAILQLSDITIVYSYQTLEDFSCFTQKICLLKTYQETIYKKLPSRNRQTKTIGYAGSLSRDIDFLHLTPAIKQILDEDPNVSFEFMGYAPKELAVHPRVKITPWDKNYQHFFKTLTRKEWIAGLAPLADTNFNRSKTNVKFREYSAAGIPGIYSNIPPYSTSIIDKKTGSQVNNNDTDWYTAINMLIENPTLGQEIRKRSFEVITKEYSIHALAAEKNNILAELLDTASKYKNAICFYEPENLKFTQIALENLKRIFSEKNWNITFTRNTGVGLKLLLLSDAIFFINCLNSIVSAHTPFTRIISDKTIAFFDNETYQSMTEVKNLK